MADQPSYVLGFLHSYDLERWLLINKGQTLSKAGNFLRWCGLGGLIEVGSPDNSAYREKPQNAMEREFLEESGYRIPAKRWHCFHIKTYLNSKIYMFQCAGSPDELNGIQLEFQRNHRDSREGALGIHQYVDICFAPEDYTFDLRYLIPMIILESLRGPLSQLDPEGVNSEYKKTLRT